jgi:hypothetical protein
VRKALVWLWLKLLQHWSDLLFAVLSLAIFVWVAGDAFTTRVVTTSQGTDYWEHSATLRALLDSPWHPKNPHLVSDASSPRFVPTFIVSALLGRAFRLDALGAMGIASALNMALLFTGIFWFFRRYFGDARASLYGLIVMFGTWYQGWHFSNVYQLRVFFSVVSYPSTAALGLSLLGFATTLGALRSTARERWLPATVVIWALVAITHPLTAVLGFVGAFLLAAGTPGVAFRRRFEVAAAIFLGGLLAFAWPYFSLRGTLSGGSHDEVAAIADGLSGRGGFEPSGRLHQFYRQRGLLSALGIALAGIPICLYLLVRRRHWFISLGAVAMLVPFVVNAYVPLPLGHRFILLAIFFLQAGVVWLLMKLTPGAPEAWSLLTVGRRGWVSGGMVALLLGVMAYWNVDTAHQDVAYRQRKLRGGESVNVRYARRVAELAGERAVVLADAVTSWPVPTFGPKVLLLWHPNPLVPDEAARHADVRRFLNGSTPDETRLSILRKYGVTHVLGNRRTLPRVSGFLSGRATRQALPGGYSLYTLADGQVSQ